MQIKGISVQGFRSFAAEQTIEFDKLRPGLYHLAGRNEVEPSLEGNGAGKSSLLEAICWGLYGRTSRNIRAGAIKNWNAKEQCNVAVNVQTQAGDVLIYRAQNPNALVVSVNGAERVVDQKTLDELLGVGADAFLFSIYFAQFVPSFIDLSPADQMGLYSTVLGLNVWEAASEAAGKRAKELDVAVQARTQVVSGLQGQFLELEALSFDAAEKEWLEGMELKDKELKASIETKQKALKVAEAELAKAAAGSEKFKAAREAEHAGSRLVATAESTTAMLERAFADLNRKDLKNCPTCGATLKDNEHIKKEIAGKKEALEAARTALAAAVASHRAAHDAWAKLGPAEEKLREANRKVTTLQTELRGLELMQQNLEKEVNPFDKQRADTAARIAVVKKDLQESTQQLVNAQAKQASAAYWPKGFKELRLSLIEESLTQLTIESNTALVELGLKDWGLRYDVERETKKGTVSKGFTVLVDAPHVKEAMPWAVWSGGESQRLRVSSSLGFGELICSRMGLAPNVELYDEPSTWLSTAGIHDLLTSLADRAQRRNKVIIVADHRTLDFGGFAGTITVVKTKGGSRIEV